MGSSLFLARADSAQQTHHGFPHHNLSFDLDDCLYPAVKGMKILCEERDLGENSIKAIDQVFTIVLHITKDEGATPIRCEQGTEICQSATDQLGNQDFSCSSSTGIIKGSGDSIATASRVPQRRLLHPTSTAESQGPSRLERTGSGTGRQRGFFQKC